MNATLIVAALGIIGTLVGAVLGPFVTARFTERREHRARLRDARTLLYVDMNGVATTFEDFMRRLVDDRYESPPRPKQLGVAETLDGRVRLLASAEIRDLWLDLQEAMRHLNYFVFEERGVQPGHGMNDEDLMLVGPRELIRRLYELTRKATEHS